MFEGLNSILVILNEHLLHWLEALSLLGRLPEAVLVVRSLELSNYGWESSERVLGNW
jgi:hypothetical protein